MLYEYPCHDVSRFCLRFEKMIRQVTYLLNLQQADATHAAIESFLELVLIVDRPDIRSKLGQALIQLQRRYQAYLRADHVDQKALQNILNQLQDHIVYLETRAKSLVSNWRQSPFWGQLLQQYPAPAKLTGFNVPFLFAFLEQYNGDKHEDILLGMRWLDPMTELIQCLLYLLRQDVQTVDILAQEGHYQCALSEAQDLALVRIVLEDERRLYPSVSLGRHRLSIHFFELDQQLQKRLSSHVNGTVPVKLSFGSFA